MGEELDGNQVRYSMDKKSSIGYADASKVQIDPIKSFYRLIQEQEGGKSHRDRENASDFWNLSDLFFGQSIRNTALRSIRNGNAQWFRTAKNYDVSTGPFAQPFVRSHASFTHSIALHHSLCWGAPLRSFIRSLAHSLPSLWESEWLDDFFCCVFIRSGP